MKVKAIAPGGAGRRLSEADRLVHEGMPILRAVARRIARRLGGRVDPDELFAFGQPTLLEVARTFDPSRGKFETYAALKLKWAIFDGLRREISRPIAGRALALAASERVSEAHAADEDVEAEPLPEEAQRDRLRGLLDAHAAALATGLVAGESELHASSPEDHAAHGQIAAALRAAVAGLPERERALVERHYFGGEQFDTIAQDLRISKSWASRLHAQAMATLGRALRDLR